MEMKNHGASLVIISSCVHRAILHFFCGRWSAGYGEYSLALMAYKARGLVGYIVFRFFWLT